jgi:hypothetical protein
MCKNQETEEAAMIQQRAVGPYIDSSAEVTDSGALVYNMKICRSSV